MILIRIMAIELRRTVYHKQRRQIHYNNNSRGLINLLPSLAFSICLGDTCPKSPTSFIPELHDAEVRTSTSLPHKVRLGDLSQAG